MLKQFQQMWSDNKRYFLVASLILIGGICIGYLQSAQVELMVKDMLSQVQEVVKRIEENGGSTAATFWVIFSNNLLSSIMMMGMGLFFAVFPVIGLLSNGVLLGFILAKISSAGFSPVKVFTVAILPHGIFELPAVVFAAAIGIRYGILVIRSLGGVWRVERRNALKKEWSMNLKQLPLAFCTVLGLLLIAAVVESVITPILMENMMGGKFHLMR